MADNADAADSLDSPAEGEDIDDGVDSRDSTEESNPRRASRHRPLRAAAVAGLAACLAIAGLTGWLGLRVWHERQSSDRTAVFLQTARQVATNLTTIDYTNADADVQRILASATGTFYDDFAQRADPFIEVVRQAQSTSTGTVTEAGLESELPDSAQVLVSVVVHSTTAGAEQPARAWRMRLAVQMVGNEPKVAKVEFVP